MSQIPYWIWLTTLSGVSTQTQLRLLRQFGSPETVFRADDETLERMEGLRTPELQALRFRDLRRAEDVLEDCRKMGFHIITMQDAEYPQRLLSIETPPLVLYYQGTLLPFDDLPVISVVGTRKASLYGLTEAKTLGSQLARCGGTVISGGAEGVDTMALEGALQENVPVAAVLGNGLDVTYPKMNKKLFERILERGCLVSEYVPGTPPYGKNFPKRNRILSGLSLGVVVVEAKQKSGSLITAELALEQGRDVYAVPGNIGEACCEGSNQLLQDGAALVTRGWDVLQNYQARYPSLLRYADGGRKTAEFRPLQKPAKPDPAPAAADEAESGKNPADSEKRIDNGQKRNYIGRKQTMETLNQQERVLMELLLENRKHVDELIDESGLTAAQVSSAVTMLELKGCVTRLPGNWLISNL